MPQNNFSTIPTVLMDLRINNGAFTLKLVIKVEDLNDGLFGKHWIYTINIGFGSRSYMVLPLQSNHVMQILLFGLYSFASMSKTGASPCCNSSSIYP